MARKSYPIGIQTFEKIREGTPTYLIEKMRQFKTLPSKMDRFMAMASSFDAPTESMTEITPLLYQSGYITIKDYDPETMLYTLEIPNKEIRVGLYESLLPQLHSTMHRGLGD